LEGSFSGGLIPEGPRSAGSSWLILPLLLFNTVKSVAGASLLRRKTEDICVVGKNSLDQIPALIFASAAALLRRLVIIPGKSKLSYFIVGGL
jgi:hypothetical protein